MGPREGHSLSPRPPSGELWATAPATPPTITKGPEKDMHCSEWGLHGPCCAWALVEYPRNSEPMALNCRFVGGGGDGNGSAAAGGWLYNGTAVPRT